MKKYTTLLMGALLLGWGSSQAQNEPQKAAPLEPNVPFFGEDFEGIPSGPLQNALYGIVPLEPEKPAESEAIGKPAILPLAPIVVPGAPQNIAGPSGKDAPFYGPELPPNALSPVTSLPDALPPLGFPSLVGGVEYVPRESNALIADRLSCIEGDIALTFNPTVRQFIDFFTVNNRKYTRMVLEREHVYFPLFEKYLAQYKMPDELKYLAVVESGLNPKAISRTKALGLWQFMPATGTDFRLKQDDYFDERYDPEKSTIAACRFLGSLYKQFGDWQVALAAYNCGAGNVRKAIKRAGGKVNFWDLYPYLPQETRGYVPSFIALTYAMKYAPEHNIYPKQLRFAEPTDTLLVSQYLDLQRFSEHLCVNVDKLLTLNPEVKRPYLPSHTNQYPLKVPVDCKEYVTYNRGWILDSCRKGAATPPALLAMLPADMQPEASEPSLRKITYKVRKGDMLSKVAANHNVTVAQVKKWNSLRSSSIMAGQKLALYQPVPLTPTAPAQSKAPETALAKADKKGEEKTEKAGEKAVALVAKVEKPAAEKSESPAAKAEKAVAQKSLVAESKPETSATATASAATSAKANAVESAQVHFVQPGDTLFNISRRYQGVTVERLKELNQLQGNEIKVGQKLIVG